MDYEQENKIPKPHGDPGRPGRGGYNLDNALGWDAIETSKLKVCRVNESVFTI